MFGLSLLIKEHALMCVLCALIVRDRTDVPTTFWVQIVRQTLSSIASRVVRIVRRIL